MVIEGKLHEGNDSRNDVRLPLGNMGTVATKWDNTGDIGFLEKEKNVRGASFVVCPHQLAFPH